MSIKVTSTRDMVVEMNELIAWECPNCEGNNEDIEGQETPCAKCGLVVYIYDDTFIVSSGYCIEIKHRAKMRDATGRATVGEIVVGRYVESGGAG